MKKTISLETILPAVFVVRGVKAMLDSDLAALYGVETKQLNQAVKRNLDRFPADFMFQLNRNEYEILRSHTVTSSWGGRRSMPYAFTEQGIAMLSSVLKSKRAIEVNIEIVRAFVKIRQLLTETDDIKSTIKLLRTEYDEKFEIVFQALDRIIAMEPDKSKPIGFIWSNGD
ncbi:MAG: ORF6N domain-containing protein [Proteobacteria bacterium]|nr:ORF6N domain-containing protein [Pseudomonadota bacterium]